MNNNELELVQVNGSAYPIKDSAARTDITELQEKLTFRFGIDEDGNYGYYKDGADTVTPFRSGSGSPLQVAVEAKYSIGATIVGSCGESTVSAVIPPSGSVLVDLPHDGTWEFTIDGNFVGRAITQYVYPVTVIYDTVLDGTKLYYTPTPNEAKLIDGSSTSNYGVNTSLGAIRTAANSVGTTKFTALEFRNVSLTTFSELHVDLNSASSVCTQVCILDSSGNVISSLYPSV